MTRKMATVRTIKSIDSIEGADRIEKATIDGWQIVVGKGMYKPGDKVIYCEIDSAIPTPDLDPDGSLAKRGTKAIDGKDYHILKTVRLRGVYSQGLILQLKHLGWRRWFTKVGQDVSSTLGVFKYDPFEIKATSSKPMADKNLIGGFPTEFARKSDSERVQNLGHVIDTLADYDWIVTEKLDGQSITLINDGDNLRVASRNYELAEHPAKDWAIANNFLEEVPSGFAVQGEWIGEGVNGNTLKLEGNDFRAFDVFDKGVPVTHWPEWCTGKTVPYYDLVDIDDATVDELINRFDGIKSLYKPGMLAEGVVFHTVDASQVSELGGRTTFKVISNKWLVKHGK